ncbi:hypothetical protein ABIA43_001204 [Bradyrhizobium sp. USDA 328]
MRAFSSWGLSHWRSTLSRKRERERTTVVAAIKPHFIVFYAAAFFRASSALYNSNSSAIALAIDGRWRRRS